MLQPLLPTRGTNGPLVKLLQHDLNARGAELKVDGDYGDKTAKALAKLGPPAAVPLPPIGMWIDRTWVDDSKDYAKTLKRVGVARAGLMLNSIDDMPKFDPFAKPDELRRAIDNFAASGIKCDLTPWLFPSKAYVETLCDYVGPAMADVPTVRLDNDCEGPWGRNGDHQGAAELLFDRVPVDRVSVNDYASIQDETRILLKHGPVRRPQLYSVAFTRHSGTHKVTTPSSVYWPGKTQLYGMDDSRWGGAGTGELDIGLAAYKPFSGRPDPIQWQIETQIRAALWFKPRELWFWSARTARAYLDVIRRLIAAG